MSLVHYPALVTVLRGTKSFPINSAIIQVIYWCSDLHCKIPSGILGRAGDILEVVTVF